MARRDSITLSNHSELFKEFYIPLAEAAINTATPTRTQIKRIKNFTGKQITGVARLSRGGGVGNDVIPAGSTRKSGTITYTPQSLWATSVLDWEAMVASGDDKGAFVDATVDEVEGTMEAFVMNESRQIFGDHYGILGALNAVPTDNGDGTFTISISNATWFYPNWEAGHLINFHTDLSKFEIISVDKSAQDLVVQRRDGSFDPSTLAGTENLYMQSSKDKELIGLKEVADTTANGANTLYGLIVQPRWQARRYNAGSKPLISDMLVEMCALQDEDTGRNYTGIIMNTVQGTSLENQLEGKKEYTQLKSKDSRFADMGWEGLLLQTKNGKVPIWTDLFCPKDRIYFVTKDKMEIRERPKFGWLEFDGKQYLREFNEGERPRYKALYGGYEQFFHHPAYLGVIYDLEVPTMG